MDPVRVFAPPLSSGPTCNSYLSIIHTKGAPCKHIKDDTVTKQILSTVTRLITTATEGSADVFI